MTVVEIHRSRCSKYITVLSALFLLISIRGQADDELIYILQWTRAEAPWQSWSLWYLEMGQKSFVSRNCSFQNCFITPNRTYLNNILDFDVLLFNIADIANSQFLSENMPKNRSESQLYVFVAAEPAFLGPISHFYKGFFNFTWTYRIESDIFHPFFVVKNNIGEVIGPREHMKWVNYTYLPPTNKSIVRKLLNKRIAAAWVSAICKQQANSVFVKKLVDELSKYGHQVHHYGRCGQLSCPRNPKERVHLLTNCYKKIESDYYFYLAFENYFAEDYVTEKVLHGLQHFLVPIVLGGADYTRFLPKGSYIDALNFGVEELAKEMYDIINDPPRYYDFFRWHGYYSFQDTTDNDHRETICELCAFFNHEINKENVVYLRNDISNWFNTIYTKTPTSATKATTLSTTTIKTTTTTTTTTTASTTINNELPKEPEPNSKDDFFSNFFSNVLMINDDD